MGTFVTLNALSAQEADSGWAVDTFGSSAQPIYRTEPVISILANIAVRGDGSSFIRVGYSLTVIGRLEDETPIR